MLPHHCLLLLASVYSARYISDRFLPDKAIDLVDEAASSLRLAQESKPDELEALDRQIVTLQIELESLKNESDVFSVERRDEVETQLRTKREEASKLGEIWQAGKRDVLSGVGVARVDNVLRSFRLDRARLHNIKETKRKLEEAKHELEVAQWQGRYDAASKLRYAVIPELEAQLPKDNDREPTTLKYESSPGTLGLSMLHDRVTSSDIARVVAKATGIPVQSLLKGEREKLSQVCTFLPPFHHNIDAGSWYRRWRAYSVSVWSDKMTPSGLSAMRSESHAPGCRIRIDRWHHSCS